MFRCLSKKEAEEVLYQTHSGTCGAHQPGPKLHDRIRRLGYYWPTMVEDSMNFARKCNACQYHADFIHQAPEPLHPSIASWPFEAWGMDIIGPINPPSMQGHRFILTVTDYFSKWAEATALSETKTMSIIKFLKVNIICRFGTPKKFIHDNGPQFRDRRFDKFCEKYQIDNFFSTPYNAAANGLAEAFNKTICKLLKKMVSKNKRDWHDRLPEALWAYRTTVRGATKTTPFALVYGSEAVLPLEIQIPSLRVALQNDMTQDEKVQLRLQELETLDEKRLQARQRTEIYQARMETAFNKKVRLRTFKKGDLVLMVKRPMIITRKSRGKFNEKWEGPFVIDIVYSNGAYSLLTQNGDRHLMPVNEKFLKKYYS